MPKYCLEDFSPGMTFAFGPRRVTAGEIIDFAAEFDPQPMHLGPVAAGQSMLGEFIASGWHTSSLMMRMAADGFVLDTASRGSAGVDEVKWPHPLRPDDDVTLHVEILATRSSQSRPEMGLVRQHWRLVTQRGDTVGETTFSMMVDRRAAVRLEA